MRILARVKDKEKEKVIKVDYDTFVPQIRAEARREFADELTAKILEISKGEKLPIKAALLSVAVLIKTMA